MQDQTPTIPSGSCLGRTCLQWSADGELTPLDLQLVLERLARVDREGAVLLQPAATPDLALTPL